jgi:hypothetical protein
MHWTIGTLRDARTSVVPAVLAVAGLLASTPALADKAVRANVVAPTEKNESSLAPLKPSETGSELDRLFNPRSKSELPGFDLPASGSGQESPKLDAKTKRGLMEAQDKKRNWMATAQEKASERKDKDGADDKGKGKGEERSDRPRSEFEKQLQAEEELERGRRQDPSRKQQGQPSGRKGSPDDDLEMVDDRPGSRFGKTDASIKDGGPGPGPSAGGFGRAIFSDPSSVFQSPASGETPTGFLNAPSNTDPDGFRRSASADRVDQMIGAPAGAATSGPGRASPSASPGANPYGEFGAPRTTRAQQFQAILDNTPSSASAAPIANPVSAQKTFGSPSAAPLPSLGSGLFTPAASPFSPTRSSAPIMKPQPGILPLPSRGF